MTALFAAVLLIATRRAGAGNAGGPAYLVKNIDVGPEPRLASRPQQFTKVGDLLLFTAEDDTHGRELWRTDRTPAGTVLVKDIIRGDTGSEPVFVTVIDDVLLFAARDAEGNFALWRSDGSEPGTFPILGLFDEAVPLAGSTLFSVGVELWTTDGSDRGTVSLATLPDVARSLRAGGVHIFEAGNQLWRSDGTVDGTFMLTEFPVPTDGITLGDRLVFFIDDPGGHTDVWCSDGTIDGTRPAAALPDDLGPYRATSTPHLAIGGELYFFRERSAEVVLWRTDCTPQGTLPLKTLLGCEVAYTLIDVGGTLFFTGDDGGGTGVELWKSDGTPSGTMQVADVHPGRESPFRELRVAPDAVAIGNTLYFVADDGSAGRELWRTDGTPPGTFRVVDLNPGAPDAFFFSEFYTLSLTQLTRVGDSLVFVATDGRFGAEIWKSDGTAAGTQLLADAVPGSGGIHGCSDTASDCWPNYYIPRIMPVGGRTPAFLFTTTGPAVWSSDLTAAGTRPVPDIDAELSWATATDRGIFFTTWNGEPCFSDGTPEHTYVLRDIRVGDAGSNPRELTAVDETLLFAADDGVRGMELWRSDATERGTAQVIDIRAGAEGSAPKELTVVGGILFFTADDGAQGHELWRSDGTESGTWVVKDIQPGRVGSSPRRLIDVGGTLFFFADDGTNGSELWRSDGSEQGTRLVKDIFPGPDGATDPAVVSSGPREADLDGVLLFAAREPSTGVELWRSDGTEDGTSIVLDIVPGSADSQPSDLTVAGDTAYFFPSGPGAGGLWRSDGSTRGTRRLQSPDQLFQLQGGAETLFFFALGDLWRSPSDGFGVERLSEAGQPDALVMVGDSAFALVHHGHILVRDGYAPVVTASPRRRFGDLAAAGNRLFFFEYDEDKDYAAEPAELAMWTSDGTPAGTHPLQLLPAPLIADDALASDGHAPEFTTAGHFVFFSAPHGGKGYELWALPISSVPQVCDECVPTPTRRATPVPHTPGPTWTPVPTRTANPEACRLTENGATCPALVVSTAGGAPGDQVSVAVRLITAGAEIAAVENDLAFDPSTPVTRTAERKPQCTVNSEVGKLHSVVVFPGGQRPAPGCRGIRAAIFGFGDTAPIPDGSILYKCTVDIAANAPPGTYPLVLSKVGAYDASWENVDMLIGDGAVIVSAPDTKQAAGFEDAGSGDGCQIGGEGSSNAPGFTLILALLALAQRRRAGISLGIRSLPARRSRRTIQLCAAVVAIGASRVAADGPARLVKDINPGPDPASSDASNFVEVGGLIFFSASDYDHGRELWRTDRTPGGTALVKDIAPGARGSDPVMIDATDGTLVFAARDGRGNLIIWRTDGSEDGTVTLANPPDFQTVEALGGPFFLLGDELWTTGRNAARPEKLADLREPYSFAGDGPERFVASGGWLSKIGATPGSFVSLGKFPQIRWMSVAPNGTLFFFVRDEDYDISLWRSYGTPGGTLMVSDFGSPHRGDLLREGGPQPHFLGDSLFFFVESYVAEGGRHEELWQSDGTAAGTRLLERFLGSGDFTYEMIDVAGTVFFVGNDGGPAGTELWKSDGTSEGTMLVADVRPGFESALAESQYWLDFAVAGNNLYFLANNGVSGVELWRSDGTERGTSMVVDLNPGPAGAFFFYDDLDQYLPEFSTVGDTLLFVANDGISGYELWKTDGSAAGTIRLADAAPGPADLFGCWYAEILSDCHPAYPTFARLGNDRREVLFTVPSGNRGAALWRSDLTPLGTRRVTTLDPGWLSLKFATQEGDGVLLLAFQDPIGTEPWWTDGTEQGTHLLQDIARGGADSNPQNLTPLGDSIFFAADDGVHGRELWQSDGTEEGTTLVADIRPGSVGSWPHNVTTSAGMLLFTADDGVHGPEPWISDGSEAGTSMTKDVRPGPDGSEPHPLGAIDGAFLFAADDGSYGFELWRTDGTSGGTVLVTDAYPGIEGSVGYWSLDGASLDGMVLYGAHGPSTDWGLWRSDGTARGTGPVLPSNISERPGSPTEMTRLGDLVYFTGTLTGGLWQTDGTREGTRLVQPLPRLGRIEAAEDALFLTAVNFQHVGELYRFAPADMELRPLGEVDVSYGFVTAAGSAFNVFTSLGSVLLRDGWYPLASAGDEAMIEPFAPRDRLIFFTHDFKSSEIVLWSSDGTKTGTSPLQELPLARQLAYELAATEVAVAGNQVFFSLLGGTIGRELWVLPLEVLPEVCRDCVPLPTPTPTRTPLPTRTATPSATPRCVAEDDCARLRVGTVSGAPGDEIVVTVELENAGPAIAALQNDLAFALDAPIAVRPDGSPDCTVNPQIDKSDTAFIFHPIGCTAGNDCTKIRAGVFAFGDTAPIPDGVLYTCRVVIAAGAEPGSHPLTLSKVLGFDASWQEIEMLAADGAVTVSAASLERAAGIGQGSGTDSGCQVSGTRSGIGPWPLYTPLPPLTRLRIRLLSMAPNGGARPPGALGVGSGGRRRAPRA